MILLFILPSMEVIGARKLPHMRCYPRSSYKIQRSYVMIILGAMGMGFNLSQTLDEVFQRVISYASASNLISFSEQSHIFPRVMFIFYTYVIIIVDLSALPCDSLTRQWKRWLIRKYYLQTTPESRSRSERQGQLQECPFRQTALIWQAIDRSSKGQISYLSAEVLSWSKYSFERAPACLEELTWSGCQVFRGVERFRGMVIFWHNRTCYSASHNTYQMKADYPSDQWLEERLKGRDVKDPELLCPSNKRISQICTNEKCKVSLICNQKDCPVCRKQHQFCGVVDLEVLTNRLNRGITGFRDFVSEVYQVDNVFIDKIQTSRDKLIREYHQGDSEDQDSDLVREIYLRKNSKIMTGRMAKDLFSRLKSQEEENQQRKIALLEDYRKKMMALTQQIETIRRRVYRGYSKGMELDTIILQNDKKGQQNFQFLRASLKQPKKIELLYRGSSNQFRADLFHQKCDNTPDTFTLLRTEFGKVIGGFSHYAWNAVKDNWVDDEGRNAFLLSFDLKQKMVPNSHQHLIHCHPNYGPVFGGADLLLADRCNQNNISRARFPNNYNFEGKYKKDNQESYKAFSGATDGDNFKVLEYEVFRVRYE